MTPEELVNRTEQMVARRVRGGAAHDDSRRLLAEHLRTAGSGTMAALLVHDGFATGTAADAFTEAYYEHDENARPHTPIPEGIAATVEHSAEGTLVHGTSRGDAAMIQALKDNGFRWSRNLDAWYLPRNLTHDTRDQRVANLQAALGERLEVEIPDGGRRLTAAEKDAATQERAQARAERMTAKAEKLTAQSEAYTKRADEISAHIPMGQPILVGHHSESRHRRDIATMHRNHERAWDASAAAEDARDSAQRAARVLTGTESVSTIHNRIERNEALVRRVDRELRDHSAAQGLIDKLGSDHHKVQMFGLSRDIQSPDRLAQLAQVRAEAVDAIAHDKTKLAAAGGVTYGMHNVEPGDLIKVGNGWTPVIRANAKSATVPSGYSWTDTIAWSKIGKVVKAEDFTPDQVRRLLEGAASDPHRASALQKTLARAERADASSATTGLEPVPDAASAEVRLRSQQRETTTPAGAPAMGRGR